MTDGTKQATRTRSVFEQFPSLETLTEGVCPSLVSYWEEHRTNAEVWMIDMNQTTEAVQVTCLIEKDKQCCFYQPQSVTSLDRPTDPEWLDFQARERKCHPLVVLFRTGWDQTLHKMFLPIQTSQHRDHLFEFDDLVHESLPWSKPFCHTLSLRTQHEVFHELLTQSQAWGNRHMGSVKQLGLTLFQVQSYLDQLGVHLHQKRKPLVLTKTNPQGHQPTLPLPKKILQDSDWKRLPEGFRQSLIEEGVFVQHARGGLQKAKVQATLQQPDLKNKKKRKRVVKRDFPSLIPSGWNHMDLRQSKRILQNLHEWIKERIRTVASPSTKFLVHPDVEVSIGSPIHSKASIRYFGQSNVWTGLSFDQQKAITDQITRVCT